MFAVYESPGQTATWYARFYTGDERRWTEMRDAYVEDPEFDAPFEWVYLDDAGKPYNVPVDGDLPAGKDPVDLYFPYEQGSPSTLRVPDAWSVFFWRNPSGKAVWPQNDGERGKTYPPCDK